MSAFKMNIYHKLKLSYIIKSVIIKHALVEELLILQNALLSTNHVQTDSTHLGHLQLLILIRRSYSVYNLPPRMCMRPEFMFLSTVIPGPKSPGRNIDVCLRPLIDELAQLWSSGALTYDISRKQNFFMRRH